MTKTKFFFNALFILSFFFILSGGFNYGFSGYVLAIPFFIFALIYSYKKLKSKKLFVAVVVTGVIAVLINHTLTLNSLFFPVLSEGKVVILKDAVLRVYDNQKHVRIVDDEEIKCTGCGTYKDIQVKAQDEFEVTGVSISHPDFSTNVSAITEIGSFSSSLLTRFPNSIRVTKEFNNKTLSHLGNLMYYPVFVMMIPSLISKIMPDVEVMTVDNNGNKRLAKLENSIARSRNVKDSDEIKIDCSKNIKFASGKLCELQFSGFDRSSPYPKNNPLYGIYPGFTVFIDENGVPDPAVLNFIDLP